MSVLSRVRGPVRPLRPIPYIPELDEQLPRPVVLFGRLGRIGVVLALVAAPWLLSPYNIGTASKILAFGLLAMSADLLTGVAGRTVLGQAAYFGVGAYTGAIVSMHVSAVGPVQLGLAILASGVAAAVTGAVAVRTRGSAFVMITIAIGQLTFSAANELQSVTKGSDGIVGVPATVPFWGLPAVNLDGLAYLYVLAAFLVLFVLVMAVVRSPFGLAVRAIRDNEQRMRASGYAVRWYLLAMYTLAGALAGAAGSLYVSSQRFISPGDIGFDISALALLAVLIGGAGSVWGACLGAAIVLLTRDYLGSMFAGRSWLLLGLLFVIVVYALPQGIAGVVDTVKRRLFLPRPAPRRQVPAVLVAAGPPEPVDQRGSRR